MKKVSALFVAVIGAYVLSTGCDPREVDLPAWESEFIVPLINADFDIRDITLTESLELKRDTSGVLSIIYISPEDEVKLSDFFSIPDRNVDFSLPHLPNGIDNIHFSAEISPSDIGLPAGTGIIVPPFRIDEIGRSADLTDYFVEALFQSGEVGLTIQNGFPFTLDAGMQIEVINEDGTIVFTHTTGTVIAPHDTYTVEPPISLANKRVSGDIKVKLNNIASSGASGVEIDAEDALGFAFSLTDLALKQATMVMPPFEGEEWYDQVSFALPFGARLTGVDIRSGQLAAVVQTEVSFPLNITFTLHSATRDGDPQGATINLLNDKKLVIDLSDTEVDLTNNGAQIANTLAFSARVSSPGSNGPVTINFEEPVTGTLQLSSLAPEAVYGYLGHYESVLKESMGLDFFKQVTGGSINFASPSVRAFVHNEFGVGVQLLENDSLYVRAANPRLFPGKEVYLNQSLKDVKIKKASTPRDIELSVIEMNGKNEPDFGKFISLLPTNVSFLFPVQVGSVEEDLSQFAMDTSRLSGHIEIKFPLEFQASALTMTDTLDLDVAFENEFSEVISGELSTNVTNYFPIELLMQVYFLNDNFEVLDSMFVQRRVITGGKVNSEGKITQPSDIYFVVAFNHDKLEHLSQAMYARPEFVLNTTEQRDVKVYADSRVNFKINGDFVVNLKNE